jgi:holo-ACP synthase CitX
MDASLRRLLAAREERAWIQNFFLSFAAGVPSAFVVQISLNVPGLPKRLDCDEDAIVRAWGLYLGEFGTSPAMSASVVNYCGPARISLFLGDRSREAKEIAISFEEGYPWGRIFDIDVMTESGAVSRSRLNVPPRKCMLCGDDAKSCARIGRHDASELRLTAEELLVRFARHAHLLRAGLDQRDNVSIF